MTPHLPGEVFALLTAMTWGCAVVFFKYSGERVPPIALNFFKNVVAILMLSVTLGCAPLMGSFLAEETLENVLSLPMRHIGILILSGVIGIALADTLFFYCLNIVGVSIVSIVDCLYSPLIIVFAFLLLAEELKPVQYCGVALVLGGVLVSSRHRPPPNTTRGQLMVGVGLGVMALASMAFGIVIAKPTLEKFPLVWAAAIRLIAGTLALLPLAFIRPIRTSLVRVFRPSAAWKSSVPGALLGTYLAYVFWVAGFKYADASVAAVLNQTSVIFSLILATVVVKEPMTRRKLVAITLALTGVFVVLYQDVQKVVELLTS
jgi:drug/metabolite transporter (DMT)-like permease